MAMKEKQINAWQDQRRCTAMLLVFRLWMRRRPAWHGATGRGLTRLPLLAASAAASRRRRITYHHHSSTLRRARGAPLTSRRRNEQLGAYGPLPRATGSRSSRSIQRARYRPMTSHCPTRAGPWGYTMSRCRCESCRPGFQEACRITNCSSVCRLVGFRCGARDGIAFRGRPQPDKPATEKRSFAKGYAWKTTSAPSSARTMRRQ